MLEKLKKNKIIAVVKSDSYENSYKFASACIEGGIRTIEVITTSPGARRLLGELSRVNDVCLGAGTVLDREVARQALDMGAEFIVSPHTDPEIVKFCNENNLFVISGAFTSSEIVNAWKMGVNMVKIFPSSTVGPGYVKAIKDPLPFVEIFVTGGITLDNIGDYISSGVSCVGLSSSLLGANRSVNYHEIVKKSKKFSEKVGGL